MTVPSRNAYQRLSQTRLGLGPSLATLSTRRPANCELHGRGLQRAAYIHSGRPSRKTALMVDILTKNTPLRPGSEGRAASKPRRGRASA